MRQVYLVENTNGKRRDRYAMKVLNTKRAFKMAEKATDSNLLGAIQQPLSGSAAAVFRGAEAARSGCWQGCGATTWRTTCGWRCRWRSTSASTLTSSGSSRSAALPPRRQRTIASQRRQGCAGDPG